MKKLVSLILVSVFVLGVLSQVALADSLQLEIVRNVQGYEIPGPLTCPLTVYETAHEKDDGSLGVGEYILVHTGFRKIEKVYKNGVFYSLGGIGVGSSNQVVLPAVQGIKYKLVLAVDVLKPGNYDAPAISGAWNQVDYKYLYSVPAFVTINFTPPSYSVPSSSVNAKLMIDAGSARRKAIRNASKYKKYRKIRRK